MKTLKHLFDKNRAWADQINQEDPEFFATLAKQQSPDYLWIGCSDSRVPANQIVDLLPGDVFVHRNVSNQVVHTDINCLSVIQYAVTVLKVKHIMVVGHYGCGGVKASIDTQSHGLIDNWLRHIRDIYNHHRPMLDQYQNEGERLDKLCELNAIEQATNVCNTTFVQEAWESGQELSVHAWVYGLEDGLLQDLHFCVSGLNELDSEYKEAVAALDKVAS